MSLSKKRIADMSACEITQLARQMARDRPLPNTDYVNPDTLNSLERSYSVSLTESQWEIINDILNTSVTKYRAIIKKTHDYRSEGVSSFQTRNKYERKIADLNEILSAISMEGI